MRGDEIAHDIGDDPDDDRIGEPGSLAEGVFDEPGDDRDDDRGDRTGPE